MYTTQYNKHNFIHDNGYKIAAFSFELMSSQSNTVLLMIY